MLGALLPLGFLVLFDQIWANQSLQDKEDELEDIFGRKLKMFGGNPASNGGKREKVGFFSILNLISPFQRQMTACFNCFPPTVLFTEPRGSKPSNTEQIKMVRLSKLWLLVLYFKLSSDYCNLFRLW